MPTLCPQSSIQASLSQEASKTPALIMLSHHICSYGMDWEGSRFPLECELSGAQSHANSLHSCTIFNKGLAYS